MHDVRFCLLACIVIGFFGVCQPRAISQLQIRNIAIVDLQNEEILPNRTVVIQDGRIVDVRRHDEADGSEGTVVDGQGKFLIPGLWDMHCHASLGPGYAVPLCLAHGVTGVRDMAADMAVVRHLRDRAAAGELLAPQVYAASPIIDGNPPAWPGAIRVDTAAEARQVVAEQIEAGVDCIKIYDRLSRDAFLAVSAACRDQGYPFVGHLPFAVSLSEAISADMASFEHLFGLMEACTSRPERLKSLNQGERFNAARMEFLMRSFDRQRFRQVIGQLANSSTWACPTLVFLRNAANLDRSEMIDRDRLGYTPRFVRRSWSPKRDPRFRNWRASDFETMRKYFRFQQRLMGEFAEAGVKLLAGTDSPGNPGTFAGLSLHDELQLLVEGGMSPGQALRTATINPARFMNRESELGQIRKGFRGDLVLLDGNPLSDIKNTTQIRAVVVEGRLLDRAALDELLRQSRLAAAAARPPRLRR